MREFDQDRFNRQNQPQTQANKFLAGRYLLSLAVAKGDARGAIAYAESQNWLDRGQVVVALQKAAVNPQSTSDMAYQPVADSFIGAMRSSSIPLQFQSAMRGVPLLTRIFVNTAGETAVEVLENTSIPVLKGNWTNTTLSPRKFAGITVQTNELTISGTPNAALALSNDLAEAVSEVENYSFVSPYQSGSVLYGASHFTCTGSTLGYVDADLKNLVDRVSGAHKKGSVFLMAQETATSLSLVRGSGGGAAYPDVNPQGGFLLGLPVLITTACSDDYSPSGRIVGLVDPSQVFWADDGGVSIIASTEAALQQSDAPSGSAQQVSLFQSDATAFKATRISSWYAKSGCSAYMTVTY
jgi:HK97 family phage major capsid protein